MIHAQRFGEESFFILVRIRSINGNKIAFFPILPRVTVPGKENKEPVVLVVAVTVDEGGECILQLLTIRIIYALDQESFALQKFFYAVQLAGNAFQARSSCHVFAGANEEGINSTVELDIIFFSSGFLYLNSKTAMR